MNHIENDECSIIRLSDFQMQRAEKQIQKDAWVAETDPFTINPSGWDKRTNLGTERSTGLLDSSPKRGPAARSLSNALGGPISTLSHEQFPPLNNIGNSNLGTQSRMTSSNLVDLDDDPANDMARLHISGTKSPNTRVVNPEPSKSGAPDNSRLVNGWLATVNSTANPPSDNHSEVASIYNRKTSESILSENVPPPSVRAADPDPAAGYKRIISMPAHSIITSNSTQDRERFWDAIRQEYICPGEKCRRTFKGALEFQKHLLSSAHVGGQVVCPSCLKRFATTTAWVAHCESASKRCDIWNSSDFNNVMREITGGVLGTRGFMEDGTVQYVAPKIEDW